MKVTLEFTSWFSSFLDGKTSFQMEAEEGKQAIDVVSSLGIPPEKLGFISVNGTVVNDEYVLKDGDHIFVYPPIVGG